MDFIASIPASASAFKVSGGEGEAVRLMLELNPTGEQLAELLALRGRVIKVSMLPE
jgi:hypothetical protein